MTSVVIGAENKAPFTRERIQMEPILYVTKRFCGSAAGKPQTRESELGHYELEAMN